MEERIVDERRMTRRWTDFKDYVAHHIGAPNCREEFLADLDIRTQGFYDEKLDLPKGQYAWGDYTAIKIWDSPEEFAREHSMRHPMPQAQDSLNSKLAMEISPRFKRKCLTKGCMIEVMGLRDTNGNNIDSIRIRQQYPAHVYCVPDELQRMFNAQILETTRFFKAFNDCQKGTSGLVFQLY